MKNKILEILRTKMGVYVSGEDMSAKLGVSRMSVSKCVKKLKGEGYAIDTATRKGYRLTALSDKPFGREIRNGLRAKVLGRKIYYFETIDSTNNKAYELAAGGAEEGTVVVAESQTAGKGRLGRKWESPEGGGIYMSIILRPDVPADGISSFTLVAALAVAKAMRRAANINPKIKWPNDIMFRGRKLGGILTEMKAQPDKLDFLIVGIGVNVNTPAERLPVMAVSMKELSGADVDRPGFAKEMLFELETDYAKFVADGFKALREECKAMSSVIGNKVRIVQQNRITEGVAEDIDEIGALIVRDSGSGEARRILSGDVGM